MSLRALGRTAVVAAGAVAVAPFAWWLMGSFERMSGEVGAADNPDYMLRPLPISGTTRNVVGLGTAVIVGAALGLLVAAVRRGRVHREWYTVFVPPAAIAGYAGTTYAEMTVPVIGANIGGAMLLLGALPFGALMVAWEVRSIAKLRQATPT